MRKMIMLSFHGTFRGTSALSRSLTGRKSTAFHGMGRRSRVFPTCLLLQVLWLSFAGASSPSKMESSFTIQNTEQQAHENNPELLAARNLVAEAVARAGTTGRLTNPEFDAEVAGGEGFEGRISLGVTQRFPLTSRLRWERNLSAVEIEIARAEIRSQEHLLKTAVRLAFYELAFARLAITVCRRQAELAAAFADSLSGRAREGFGSALDGQQATLSASLLKARTDLLATDEVLALGRLNNLLGRPADAAFSIAELLELPRETPKERAMGDRPDLRLAELMVQAGETGLSLAKASRWEDVGVGLFVEGERFRDDPGGIEPETLIGMRFSIPLPLWQNSRDRIAEKDAIRSRLVEELAALRLTALNEVLISHQILSIRHRSAREMQDGLVPAARKQVEDAEGAYLRGELAIDNVFQARERLVETESAALEARKSYFLSHAEWIAALGETDKQP